MTSNISGSTIRTYRRKGRTKTSEEYGARFDPESLNGVSTERKVDSKRRRMAETKQRSKYDIMFEESEKSASKKFDAMFASTGHIQCTKHTTRKNMWCMDNRSKVVNDLPLFDMWEDPVSSRDHLSHSSESKSSAQCSKKLPHITHASMTKLGDRLVLNIQRGGNSNSLAEKGGTLLLTTKESSPLTSSVATNKTNSVECAEDRIASDSFDDLCSPKKGIVDLRVSPAKVTSYGDSSTSEKKLFGTKRNKVSKATVFYNPRPWSSDSNFAVTKPIPELSRSSTSPPVFSETSTELPSKPTKSVSLGEDAIVDVIRTKNCDKVFAVVKHVKNYQNCLEEGEIQEFENELEYLLEGLSSDQPNSVRCLSITNLARKCEQQNFRLYLRAHNVLSKVFEMLQDAEKNKALGLATSSLLYMLSRDRQIDIDKVTLKILLKLIDPLDTQPKVEPSSKVTTSHETKFPKLQHIKSAKSVDDDEEESVRREIIDMVDGCGDPLVTSSDLSTKALASEALLRYTARRTGDWYREEIRLKGGLDHVIDLVKCQLDIVEDISDKLDSGRWLSKMERPLRIMERLLRVLENSITNSPRNAMYLVTHQRALLIRKISLYVIPFIYNT